MELMKQMPNNRQSSDVLDYSIKDIHMGKWNL